MKFEVNFGGTFSLYQPLYGPGTAHLLETGLVFEGHRPTSVIPSLPGFLYPLFTALSVLTIPYSTILAYSPPVLLLRFHTLHVVLPKRGRVPFLFRVNHASADFTARLNEYRTAARAFGQEVEGA